MGDRTCLVDGCDRAANVPGSAKGMCVMHYQRVKKHGDPHYVKPRRVGIAPCSIDGCGEVIQARGWCVKHWTRWSRYGDPVARMAGEVVDGCRICPMCGEDKPLAEWSKGYCRACVAARMRVHRLEHPYVPVEGRPLPCDCCGQTFMADKRRNRYCSRECFAAYKNRANWKHMVARRARLLAATVETFDRVEIFERDEWICQLCRSQVNRAVSAPHPDSPSLDHITPLARGGEHSRANAQTACLGCNVRKGARLTA